MSSSTAVGKGDLIPVVPHEKHAPTESKGFPKQISKRVRTRMTTHGANMTIQSQDWRGVVRFVSAVVACPVQAHSASLITRNDAKREPSGLRGDPA